MPKTRVKTIKQFASAVASGEVDLTAVKPLDETVDSLIQLPGIGPWTAHFIAGRVMGLQDAFPACDLGLRRSASILLGKSETLTADEVENVAEAWRPYRFVAAAYLWMSDETDLVQNRQSQKTVRRKK